MLIYAGVMLLLLVLNASCSPRMVSPFIHG